MLNLEPALGAALDQALRQPDGEAPDPLAQAIRYSLLAPGKRIRPRLLAASARMLGLKEPAALPAALAIEMVHCFTLIHDDLPCMDNSDLRRGLPSNHRKFGEATALLAGDALMAVAVETLTEAAPHVSGPAFARALKRLCWAMGPRGVIGGQAAEPLLGPDARLEDLHRMHAGKTGALFSAALLIPADLAEIDLSSPGGSALAEFSRSLGMAFQIADDLDDALQSSSASSQEKTDPKNILYYLDVPEARKLAHETLAGRSKRLAEQWGENSRELLSIAAEVQKGLEPR